MARGGSLFMQEDFVPAEVVRALREERIVCAVLVPAMIQACLATVPDVAERRYERLRLIDYGASPIAEETLRRAMEVFGATSPQAYGMTETTAALTFLSPADHQRALAARPELLLSAGRRARHRVAHRRRDATLPPGAIGEIVARGPQLMRGYWNLPEATRARRCAAAGCTPATPACSTTRATSTSGPREGHDRLGRREHLPARGRGRPVPAPGGGRRGRHRRARRALGRGGEGDRGAARRRGGRRGGADRLLPRRGSRGFKRPRSVDFVDALPRNPSGKVLKRELREPYWAGRDRRVGGA